MKSKLIFSITLITCVIFSYSQDKILMEASNSIKIDELKEKMYTYSSDEFEGKDTPSRGQELAVAKEMIRAGIESVSGSVSDLDEFFEKQIESFSKKQNIIH